jgi:chemotaxis signal transduction protein
MIDVSHICVAEIDNSFIGFDVQAVRAVYEVTNVLPLPMKLKHVIGVFNRRGQVLSVVDTLSLCNVERKKDNDQPAENKEKYITLLHLEGAEGACCLTMDSVDEVREIENDLLREPPPSLNSALKVFCRSVFLDRNNRTIMILDFDEMFESLSKTKEAK